MSSVAQTAIFLLNAIRYSQIAYPWQWDSDAACGKLMGSSLLNMQTFRDLDQSTLHFTVILFQRSFWLRSKEPTFLKCHYLDGDEPLGKLLMQGDFIPHYQAGSDNSNFAGVKKMSSLNAEWQSVTHQAEWVGDGYGLQTSEKPQHFSHNFEPCILCS